MLEFLRNDAGKIRVNDKMRMEDAISMAGLEFSAC